MINGLLNEIASHGNRGAVAPFSRIDDLKKDMLDLKNGEYHTEWLDRMVKHITDDTDKFIPPSISFKPRSLIVAAIPCPKVIHQFHYCGNLIPCVMPPTYTNWETTNKQTLRYITDYLTPLGFSVAMSETLPQKLLAVHCGLAQYGRNNICYIDEFGSYIQIMTCISDLPCNESPWFPVRRMESCDKCFACVTSCPTSAIDSNRQLINSDKCLTLLDEYPGDFPQWLNKDAHNGIFGCTKCQDCCPGNAHNKDNIVVGVTFTEEETTELLNHKGDKPYTDSLSAKIEAMGIAPQYGDINLLPRNMAVLLQKACIR
jgi:epoxyqueuosine reductase